MGRQVKPGAPFSIFSDTSAGTLVNGVNNGGEFSPPTDKAGLIVVWTSGDSTATGAALSWEVSSDGGTTWHPLTTVTSGTPTAEPFDITLDPAGADDFATPASIGPSVGNPSGVPIFGDVWRAVFTWTVSAPGTTASLKIWWCPTG